MDMLSLFRACVGQSNYHIHGILLAAQPQKIAAYILYIYGSADCNCTTP